MLFQELAQLARAPKEAKAPVFPPLPVATGTSGGRRRRK
jgi:hypothetical protein